VTITNNSITDNAGSGFISYFNYPGPDATLDIANNVISNNHNINSNASGGISFDGFNSVVATIEKNTFSENAQGNSIGKNGSSSPPTPNSSSVTFTDNQLSGGDTFDFEFYGNSPAIGCLTIFGNTSIEDPAYIFQQDGSGFCYIVPCNYDTANTGGFSLYNILPSTNCLGETCP
ncbi:MAG: hypothetical protein JSS09_08965, partial [Verrucomicrobia bacterium]|nr:hypothetical protein [Verrucomicrobiota bacterium]